MWPRTRIIQVTQFSGGMCVFVCVRMRVCVCVCVCVWYIVCLAWMRLRTGWKNVLTLIWNWIKVGQEGSVKTLSQISCFYFSKQSLTPLFGFLGGSVGKESACNAGDMGSVPGWRRSPGAEHATHSSILAWKVPWTEEPEGLWSRGSQRVRYN